jgi:hypothetical protein
MRGNTQLTIRFWDAQDKIRKRQRQREPPMAHSEVNDVKLVLVSARANVTKLERKTGFIQKR